MYQSTVEFHYWTYYQNGEQKWLYRICTRKAIVEKIYAFDIDNMEKYTEAMGINALVYHDFDKGWKIIKYNSIINLDLSKISISFNKLTNLLNKFTRGTWVRLKRLWHFH
jgi:hypothetical protein